MKEKTADEMFEELGYEKIFEDNTETQYEGKCTNVEITRTGILLNKLTKYKTVILTVQELQAINKKVEELGWN